MSSKNDFEAVGFAIGASCGEVLGIIVGEKVFCDGNVVGLNVGGVAGKSEGFCVGFLIVLCGLITLIKIEYESILLLDSLLDSLLFITLIECIDYTNRTKRWMDRYSDSVTKAIIKIAKFDR